MEEEEILKREMGETSSPEKLDDSKKLQDSNDTTTTEVPKKDLMKKPQNGGQVSNSTKSTKQSNLGDWMNSVASKQLVGQKRQKSDVKEQKPQEAAKR